MPIVNEAEMKFVLSYGIITGLICFLIGFVGPIIFMPEANQGPLLGIFITGPLGFVLGIILGVVFKYILKKKPDFKHPFNKFITM
jgi:hypothetical protein